MVKRSIRRQTPVRGGRLALPSCVLREIHEGVEAEAQRYGVSRSFVIAVALAHAFGVKDQETYRMVRHAQLRRVK